MIYFFSTITGIFAGQNIHFNFYISMILIIISILVFIFIPNSKYKICFLIIFLFLASGLNASLHSVNLYEDNQKIEDCFIVKSVSNNKYILRRKGTLEKFSAFLKEKYDYGDVIKLSGNVNTFEKSMNECGINIYNRKKSMGIDYSIKVTRSEKISGPSILKKAQKLFISHSEKVLNKYLNNENSKLMLSIILANKDYISVDTVNDFNNAGISHILALSGLHIVIIITFFDIIMSIIGVSKIKRRAFALSMVFVYIYFVGYPPGAIRSYIMSLCLYLSFLFKWKYDSLKALEISAVINMFINPYCIFSIAFIFSYVSVLSILLFYKRLKYRTSENIIISSFVLTFSVAILLFPLNEYLFYNFSLLGFISNLLIVPIYSLGIILSFIIIILSFTGYIIAPFLNLILNFARLLIYLVNKINFLNIKFKVFTLNYLIVYYVIIFIVFKKRDLKWLFNFKNLIYIYSFFAVLFLSYDLIEKSDLLQADFLYVDQGDCTIIQYKNKNYLIDTGGCYFENYSPGKIYTLNYLRKHGIYTIDGLFISHFDSDHIEGIFDIMDYTDIKNIYISYVDNNEIFKNILNYGYDVYLLNKDDVIKLSDNCYIKVITDSSLYTTDNDKSLVLNLKYGSYSMLFTGDISEKVERDIKGEYDLIKISHHGSKFSTSEDFLKKVKPEFAIISAGINNSYNHPSSEVIKRLDNRHIRTYITAIDGEVFTEISDKLSVQSYLKSDKNYDILYYVIIYLIIFIILIYKTRYLWITKMYM